MLLTDAIKQWSVDANSERPERNGWFPGIITHHIFKIPLTGEQIIECVRLLLQVPTRIKREAA